MYIRIDPLVGASFNDSYNENIAVLFKQPVNVQIQENNDHVYTVLSFNMISRKHKGLILLKKPV